MKRFFTLIILCLLLYACKPGIPKNIIQPDKMEKVLFDIHIVDGYITSLSLPSQDTSKFVAAPLYKGIYKKFEIDSAIYNQSLDYYYKHPSLLKKIYDSLSVKLNVVKEQVTKELAVNVTEFSNVFENAKDSTQIDRSLNHKYNYKYLMKDIYGNVYNEPYFSAASSTSTPILIPSNKAIPIPIPRKELSEPVAKKPVE